MTQRQHVSQNWETWPSFAQHEPRMFHPAAKSLLTGKHRTFHHKANLPRAWKCSSWKLMSSRREVVPDFAFLTSAKRGSHVANIWIISNSPDGTLEIYITYLVISLSRAKGNSLKARLWLAGRTATNKISEDVCLSMHGSPRHWVLRRVLEKQPTKSP